MMDVKQAAQRKESLADHWSGVFDVRGREAQFERLASTFTVRVRDIFTSRLQHTMHFCGTMQNGRMRVIGNDGSWDFTAVLDVIAVMVHHARLVRADVAPMRGSAFLVRMRSGAVRPALPVEQLAALTGRTPGDISVILAALVRDGVVTEVERFADGRKIAAVVVHDDIASDQEVRRLFVH